ncbi:hypothetical protein TL16_g06433 [Triparma laevis f. inornata]|uniref:Uncharacterized protein n=1 Tax=Triparma laevis f. inornata TaxID=1714386 RepID=A0A9W7ECY9_9STRA|nr:hypothetical protein TL16_g06433 [Triparma laevis f. inornata]
MAVLFQRRPPMGHNCCPPPHAHLVGRIRAGEPGNHVRPVAGAHEADHELTASVELVSHASVELVILGGGFCLYGGRTLFRYGSCGSIVGGLSS